MFLRLDLFAFYFQRVSIDSAAALASPKSFEESLKTGSPLSWEHDREKSSSIYAMLAPLKLLKPHKTGAKPAFDLLIVLNVPEVLRVQVQRRVSTGASVASQDL